MSEGRRNPAAGSRWRPWLLACLLVAMHPVAAEELSDWFGQDLTPWLEEQLSTHPRFKGEPLRVAAFDGPEEDPTPSLLATSLVGRLEGSLARRPGIHLAWQPNAPNWGRQPLSMRQHCRPAEEAYVVSIEVSRIRSSMATVRTRILDVHERQWVPGMSREWQGRLDRDELVKLETEGSRDDLLGNRDLPFRPGQEDLLAARAARSLGCALLAHPAEGLRLWVVKDSAGGADGKVARLVPQYLAGSGLLRVVESQEQANMTLSVESQPLDGGTRQLWIALAPSAEDPALPNIRTSVYASAAPIPRDTPGSGPQAYARAQTASPHRPNEIEGDLRAVLLVDGRLEVRAPGFEHLEFLVLSRDGSVARWDPGACSDPGRQPGPGVFHLSLSREDRRQLAAIYTVAARGREAADALAGELRAFPASCERSGLRGAALRGRLMTVERRLAIHGGDIHWRQVPVAEPISGERLAGGWE